MNPLPPLQLVDSNTFLIDNSGLELLRCPKLFELQFVRKRVKSTPNPGANFGSTMHCGWAVRYQRRLNQRVSPEDVPHIHSAMLKWLEEHPQPLEDFRDYNHACRVMECYNEHYQDEKFTILKNAKNEPIIENSFAFPFGTVAGYQIIYTGKVDLGIGDDYGIWSFDHKTSFQFGKNWELQMMMDGGQIGYCWALQQTMGRPAMGYIIDGVRIRKPSRKDEYTGVPPVDQTDLVRIPQFVTQDTIEEWRENVIKQIELIFHFHKQGYFPMYRWQCVNKYGACDMYNVCSIGRKDRQNALDSNMYEDNKWSPLKPVEQIASNQES